MAIQRTRGVVLKREDIRETSVLLTAYTRDFGKIKLISKGARSPEQRFLSAYELFALDDIVFYERKKKDIFLLSQCELVEFFPKARESLERLAYAVYFVEFVNAVTPVSAGREALYELLLDCLRLLSSRASAKRVARIFEIKLLSLLGLMPRLGRCALCDKKVEKERMGFSLSAGGVLCQRCSAKQKGARPILAGTVNFISHIENSPFERITNIKVAKRVGNEVERILGSFITYHLDIRLKSMEFIRKTGV